MRCRWAPTLGVAAILMSSSAAAEPAEKASIAGYRDGFYLRDPGDNFRLYPRIRLNLDAHGFFGPGVADVPSDGGGVGLAPRLFVRRFRLEVGGDFFKKRISFLASAELGGQALSNVNGRTEQTAARPGQQPTAATARYAPVEAVSSNVTAQDVWINLHVVDGLDFMLGQYQAPISMENRTSEGLTPFMERNIAIRGFVVPGGKETGITAWGDIEGGVLSYEIGAFGGDGQNRPQVDSAFDVAGRIVTRPLLRAGGPVARAQLGASARVGVRDSQSVGYDIPQITSGQGFVLWDSTYRDTQNRLVHIIPSGTQSVVGGELRIPFGIGALQSEAYYVSNRTREAVDGFQLTNTERLGLMRGVGWYAQLSFWPFGDAFVGGEPGVTRPRSPDLSKPEEPLKKGLELIGIVSGINARYDGAARGGATDAKTPRAPIIIYEYGFAASYWMTRALRVTANYIIYHTPNSGSADNMALVPGNIATTPRADAHLLHELGARVSLQL